MKNQANNKASPSIDNNLTGLSSGFCWNYYEVFVSSNNRSCFQAKTEEEDAIEIIENNLLTL